MLWIYAILVFFVFYYTAVSVLLLIGVSRLKKNIARSIDLPFVSVLVPAKNEGRFIANCLESLAQQQYPSDKYEVVVVNDRSTDNTLSIIKDYMEKYEMIKCVNIDSSPSGMTGKQNAMNEGLKVCTGEIILNTDADCIVGSLWLRRIVSHFAPQVGLTIGFSTTYRRAKSRGQRAKGKEDKGMRGRGDAGIRRVAPSPHPPVPPRSMLYALWSMFFTDLQSLDMLFLMDAAAGAIGMRFPISCLGRNLAYRKAVLDEVSYLGMGYTITEDAVLIQTVARSVPNWDITVVYDKDATVLTFAEERLKQFLSQRIRWVLGGQATRSWLQIPLHVIFLFHLCLAISFLLMFFIRSLIAITLLAILIKAVLDFVRCWRVCKEFQRADLLRLFIPYEVFMVFYSILAGLGSIFIRKVRWKGEVYTRNARHPRDQGLVTSD